MTHAMGLTWNKPYIVIAAVFIHIRNTVFESLKSKLGMMTIHHSRSKRISGYRPADQVTRPAKEADW